MRPSNYRLLALAMTIAILMTACSTSSSPTAPTAAASPSGTSSGGTGGFTLNALPVIEVPDGIACSDAPNTAPFVRVSGVDLKVDVEWSQVRRATGYDVEVERFNGTRNVNAWVLDRKLVAGDSQEDFSFQATEWGSQYRVRVRTKTPCGVGAWSAFATYSVNKR